MGKEIERKWLLKPDVNIEDILTYIDSTSHVIIRDYYLTNLIRLRQTYNTYLMENHWFITIKSNGTICREEYEYELKYPPNVSNPYLEKHRYKMSYEGQTFEFNQFKKALTFTDYYGDLHKIENLYIVEKELSSVDEHINLPYFLGKEITEDKHYYGYNLFKATNNPV